MACLMASVFLGHSIEGFPGRQVIAGMEIAVGDVVVFF
jgi:hypothetical protein